MNLSFPSGSFQLGQLAGSVIIITGAGRSGKTLVGNLLGSCQRVEHLDEPWVPMVLPILASQAAMPHRLALEMFQASVVELWYDRILMRHANFRPADLSSIWRQKTPEEIFERLINLYSRDDVRRYAEETRPVLVLTLTDTLPYCEFFREALHGCRIIHVLREGIDVALEVEEKGWLSDGELLQPKNALPYRSYQRTTGTETHFLPFWVEVGFEEQYLNFPALDRGLYYWRRMIETSDNPNESMENTGAIVVKLADLIDHPKETLHGLTEALGLTQTDLTQELLSKVIRQDDGGFSPTQQPELDADNLSAAKRLYDRFGLPDEKLDRFMSSRITSGHQ